MVLVVPDTCCSKIPQRAHVFFAVHLDPCHRPTRGHETKLVFLPFTVPQTLFDAQIVFYGLDFNSKASTYPCGESARF